MKPKLKTSDLPQLGGWAPGGYLNDCVHCGQRFQGDKRATSCHECSYKNPATDTPAPMTDAGNGPIDTPRTNKVAKLMAKQTGDGDGVDWISFTRLLERELAAANDDLSATAKIAAENLNLATQLASEHAAVTAEIQRLRSLVEEAYGEGVKTAFNEPEMVDWDHSFAKRKLDQP